MKVIKWLFLLVISSLIVLYLISFVSFDATNKKDEVIILNVVEDKDVAFNQINTQASYQKEVTEPTITHQEKEVTEPTITHQEKEVIEPIITHQEKEVTEPIITHQEKEVTEPIITHQEKEVTEPTITYEQKEVTEPTITYEEKEVTEPTITYEEKEVTEPTIEKGDLIENKEQEKNVVIQSNKDKPILNYQSYLIYRKEPTYPRQAIIRRQQGKAFLLVKINYQGLVEEVSILQSSKYDKLDKAALQALKEWKFKKFDQKIKFKYLKIPVNFILK